MHLMILGQATIATLETTNPCAVRGFESDPTQKNVRHSVTKSTLDMLSQMYRIIVRQQELQRSDLSNCNTKKSRVSLAYAKD